MKMTRRLLVFVCGALLLAACQNAGGNGNTASAESGRRSAYESADDMAQGSGTAKAVLIEYASVTCVHCRDFHNDVYPTLKTKFIDTGKLRFVFRESPTPPSEVSTAGFILARCAGPKKYFDVVEAMFDNQGTVFDALRAGKPVGSIYFGIVDRVAGIKEDKAKACLADEKLLKTVVDKAEGGTRDYNVTGTPALILNGKRLESAEYFTAEGLSAAIDKALAGQAF